MQIDFQPVGRRVKVEPGTTLLEAARLAGVDLVAVCGGGGTCGTCQVRLVTGELSAPGADERLQLGEKAMAEGLRLACQTIPLSDARIDLPPQSLTTPQRTQIEGLELNVTLDPPVIGCDVKMTPPHRHDLRSDLTRLKDALAEPGFPRLEVDMALLPALSERLRELNWCVRAVVNREAAPPRLVALLPPNTSIYGLAVDVGTTKLAAYLVDLHSGKTAARVGVMNPQIAYGEDVIARIAYSNQKKNGREILQAKLVETLNEMLASLCAQVGIVAEQVVAAVIVGNTAMHHLLAGLPVRQLGAAPYVPAISDALQLTAWSAGLHISPAAPIYLPPNIAGYVGADHVAMLLGTEAWKARKVTVAMDIGTNTEITLAAHGRLFACSCASGPAFEGAHIHAGMRAAPGAIERIQIRAGKVLMHTIENQPPVGICGSGILDAAAQMVESGLVDRRGALNRAAPGVRAQNHRAEYVLVPAANSGSGSDIVVTREDINQVQLAKAAIRAGLEVLLKEAGLGWEAVEDFVIAGAFGTYLDVPNAVRIAMFPGLPLERFRQVGNAAGTGARQLLVSRQKRREADEISRRLHYVELTTYPDFTNIFVNAMYF